MYAYICTNVACMYVYTGIYTKYVHICSFAVKPDVDWGNDLAFGKPTKQSTVTNDGWPSKAVDGYPYTNYKNSTCTHTENVTGNWWQVDLGSNYEIRQVWITNRGDDCCCKFNQTQVRRVNVTLLVDIRNTCDT